MLEGKGNTAGVLHTEETKTLMRANYSDERRAAVGALNRGKQFSPEEKMRISALNRKPLSKESRELVSLNSAKALLFNVSMLDGSLLTNDATSIIIRTIPCSFSLKRKVADYIGCNERTVRRALKSNGAVKKKMTCKTNCK